MCATVEDFVFIRYRKLVDRVRFGLRLDCAAHTRRRQVCTRRLSAWNGRNAEERGQHNMSSSLGVNFAWCVPKSCRICSQPATSHSDFHRLPLPDIARGLPERRTNCPHRKDAYRPPSQSPGLRETWNTCAMVCQLMSGARNTPRLWRLPRMFFQTNFSRSEKCSSCTLKRFNVQIQSAAVKRIDRMSRVSVYSD